MIDQLLEQLASFDPDTRRQAIVALGRSKDLSALSALADVFRHDPDTELRELARKAGVYIRSQHPDAPAPASSSASKSLAARDDLASPASRPRPSVIRSLDADDLAPPPTPPGRAAAKPKRDTVVDLARREDDDSLLSETEAPADKGGLVKGKQYFVTPDNRERAKKLTDSALTLNIAGEDAKAIKTLEQALRLNPNLINEAYFGSIASAVTGEDGDRALSVLTAGQERKTYIKQAKAVKQQARVDKHMAVVNLSTGAGVGFEMIIYLLTTILGPILVQLIAVQTTLNYAMQIAVSSEDAAVQLSPIIEDLASALSVNGVISYVITGAVFAALGFLQLLVITTISHFVAKYLLRGHGTWNHLADRVLIYYNRTLPFLFFFFCLQAGIIFVGYPISLLLFAPMGFLLFRIGNAVAGEIGEAYDIGFVRGILAYTIAAFVFAALVIGLTLIITTAFATAIEGFFGGSLEETTSMLYTLSLSR